MKEKKQIPSLPHTWDELSECLKEGEEEYERGEGILWEDAIQQNRKTIIMLRGIL